MAHFRSWSQAETEEPDQAAHANTGLKAQSSTHRPASAALNLSSHLNSGSPVLHKVGKNGAHLPPRQADGKIGCVKRTDGGL